MAKPRTVTVADADDRLERLQRALDQELASSSSLNIRGSSLGGFSAIALLLALLFAAIWLDDAKYELTDIADAVLRYGLIAVGTGFAACVVLSLIAITPRGTWRGEQTSRVDLAARGSAADEAHAVATALEKQRVRNDGKSRWLQLASAAMTIALLAVVAQALAFTLGSDVREQRTGAVGPLPGLATVPLDAERQRELAERYAPVVWLHSRDEYKPMRVGTFLRGSRLTWRTRRGKNKVIAARGKVEDKRLGRGCDPGCYSVGGYIAPELTRPYFGRDRPPGLER
ncbi:MAG: hypothetical protein M3131_10165, partial [Actinomycetota bacterium]|nr:hypothetical protein [Actinomycetota bacterium]